MPIIPAKANMVPTKLDNLRGIKEKLVRTFIHGFLHLLGYDHIKNNDYKKMLKREKILFKSVISKIY